ncbi:hypothetical protein GCM10009582_00010 [Arthrobacter flavus]
MAAATLTRLGLRSVLKLTQILGNSSEKSSESTNGPTRSAFVKGGVGAVLGAALLLGSKPAAAAMKEADPWMDGETPVKGSGREMDATEIRAELASNHGVIAVGGYSSLKIVRCKSDRRQVAGTGSLDDQDGRHRSREAGHGRSGAQLIEWRDAAYSGEL